MVKICVTCGAEFAAPPSSKKITCSNKCSRVRKQQSHTGKSNQWSEESRQALSERGQTQNLQLGTPAAQASPIAGPFETNQEAKIWWLVDLATDRRYEIRNLRKFCRDNPNLFAPDPWKNAYAGIEQVQRWLLGRTKRTVSRWKTWTLERPAVHPSEIGEEL